MPATRRNPVAGAPMPAPAAAAEVTNVLRNALARDDARRVATADMLERDFERNVVDWAQRFDWLAVHFGGNQTGKAYYDAAGFPDLLLIHPSGPIWFRELKVGRNKLSPRQQRWYERLDNAGADVAVWRPDNWPDIVDALSFGRGRLS